MLSVEPGKRLDGMLKASSAPLMPADVTPFLTVPDTRLVEGRTGTTTLLKVDSLVASTTTGTTELKASPAEAGKYSSYFPGLPVNVNEPSEAVAAMKL